MLNVLNEEVIPTSLPNLTANHVGVQLVKEL